jgi:hypothetical protein
MTVVIAWVRTVKTYEELVFVSDSRLSGDGRVFDACPKILTLPRTDCVVAYSGYSGHAYPMILQLERAIDSYAPSRRGSLDISPLRTHALKIFDRMGQMIKSSPNLSVLLDTSPEASFVFGGYSWVRKEFEIWSMVYSNALGRFVAHGAKGIGFSTSRNKYVTRSAKSSRWGTDRNGKIVFAGDQGPRARRLLLDKLNAEKTADRIERGLDLQPFEVVRDMLRDPLHPESIGGAPQIVKVYQYMHSAALAVYWPRRKDGVYLQGRPCLGYERIDNWVLDPDTLESEHPVYTKGEDEFLSELGADKEAEDSQ